MSVWLDKKYVNLLSSHLPRFKWKNNTLANCRCVVCGDSQTSQIKARGYLFPSKQNYVYKCHDCGVALPFANLLQRVSRPLYDDYMMEKFREGAPQPSAEREIAQTAPKPTRGIFLHPEMHQLSGDVPEGPLTYTQAFLHQRKLPLSGWKYLFGTVEAHTFIKKLVDDKRALRVKDGVPYLVIPLRLPDGMWYGAQFRTIDKKEYFTFRWSDEPLRTFGLNYYKPKQPAWICEGPFDALCHPNTLASCGSDIIGAYDAMVGAGIKFSTIPTLIWDNEPKNKQITTFIRTAISREFPVVIWQKHLPKDLNEMVKSGLNVTSLIAERTFSGLRAELEFMSWKDV